MLPASQFQHIIGDFGRTSEAYARHAGRALSLLSESRRGTILQKFCRYKLSTLHPDSKFEEPAVGSRCDGRRRSANQSEWDFTMDGRRIECKSGQMSWDRHLKCWRVCFHRIKFPLPGVRDCASFDDLYLTIFSPDSLHIIKHDFRMGVSTSGKRTESSGHCIYVNAPKDEECWCSARSQILRKLLTSCTLVAHVDLAVSELSNWFPHQVTSLSVPQDHAYEGVPLVGMSNALRGLRIEKIALKVDRSLHPNSSFLLSDRRVDWIRDGVGVEVKASQMYFNFSRQTWVCKFQGIKYASKCGFDHTYFDELWLAIYSPCGIHFLKHPGGTAHFVDNGLQEQDSGKVIVVSAPKYVLDVREALKKMLEKMEAWGCQLFAEVLWD